MLIFHLIVAQIVIIQCRLIIMRPIIYLYLQEKLAKTMHVSDVTQTMHVSEI